MPLLLVLLVLLGVMLLVALMIPLSLVGRYRAGKARRRARGWMATVNIVSLLLSAFVFLTAAALTTYWVPRALPWSAAGLGTGMVVGLIGLAITRWEPAGEALHYTPNRWLVLALTLLVTARILYGFWRGWHAWREAPGEGSWLAALGIETSMAAGGVVIGYYLLYFAGLRWRLRRHERRFR